MKFGRYTSVIGACFLFLLQGTAVAEAPPESGFLEDYSMLKPADAAWADYVYVTEKYEEGMANIEAIIIPEPELFLAADSKYRGIKPSEMRAITEGMQQLFAEALAENYQIANSPGRNTVVLNMAFSNLYLKRKPRTPVVGWLPPVFMMTTAKRKFLNEFADNILLTELVWEGQLTDSQTGEILGLILVRLGDKTNKKKFSSWDELMVTVSVGAHRLRCRFDNVPLPAANQRDCFEITEADIDLGE